MSEYSTGQFSQAENWDTNSARNGYKFKDENRDHL